jgi:UDP-N-acetylmuramate--alanine ligase
MNIYFSGIGGVGLGPLAEIALDAGYSVQGSDTSESLMTDHLSKRGIAINYHQDGSFLRESHKRQTVDWFVFTSGLPEDHPEIAVARELGIKQITKRDELLDTIIREKNLKLLAIAGTHGKTTTSGMAVWTLRKLGIPVSYSVGTTLTFGPSGHFDPASEYFVYECDEFDRNFLQFHPHLAVIPSIDYDHSETYGSPDEYMAAFRQFIGQSSHTILWQAEANMFGETPNTTVLVPDDIIESPLIGDHNRRNATLVVKMIEALGIEGNAREIVNQFPGVDRRFEKLAPNLYTDYGHHPVEIAATLQLASEVSKNIVLVYQPHQNIRQHELRHYYSDCFEQANEIYWLPTYLTRENPDLPILSPEELIQDIEADETKPVHVADLNDELWKHIQEARSKGALVLCMGAGTIDEWVRSKLENH